jgi:hypothetical protein
VVGLYFDPPERALVLCVDEKTQVQAREPTAPAVPTQPGQLERRTHDEAAVAVALAGGDGFAAVAAAQGVAVATARAARVPQDRRARAGGPRAPRGAPRAGALTCADRAAGGPRLRRLVDRGGGG